MKSTSSQSSSQSYASITITTAGSFSTDEGPEARLRFHRLELGDREGKSSGDINIFNKIIEIFPNILFLKWKIKTATMQPNYMSGPLQQDPAFMEPRLFQTLLQNDFRVFFQFFSFFKIFKFLSNEKVKV